MRNTPRRLMICMAWIGLSQPLTLLAADGRLDVDWDVNGFFRNETAFFTQNGNVIGQRDDTGDAQGHHSGNPLKFENALNLFINGRFSEETNLHAQLNLIHDGEATDNYRSHRTYSQNDYLRELYLDTAVQDVKLRLGKQQVVWGTADGIKLLDILNPTDYREFVQNVMEDSRVPVWMAKAETPVGQDGHIQVLATQRQKNLIPGMNEEGDRGHAFVMKGVDAITGPVNGFRNITPALGGVSGTFARMGALPFFNTSTVQEFVDNQVPAFSGMLGGTTSAGMLNRFAQMTNRNNTNLIQANRWDPDEPRSAFEYMNNATFATFNTFVNANSAYRVDEPGELDPNLGMRYKGTLGSSFRYSLNYLYHYDPNPYVDLHWENNDGNKLQVETRTVTGTGPANGRGNANQAGMAYTTVNLRDRAGNYYGAVDPNTFANINRPATLVFTERMNRIHSLGGAFDTTVDTNLLGPVVLRGEALYQKDTKTPIVDRTRMGYGDLAGGLTSVDADQFKYVLGGDITVWTNLMISGQFIQFINLDYTDQGNRYTADPAVMHLSNGLQKGAEYKEMFSLFLSKPFGEEQQGRVNNLTIYEEKGGYWNRLGLEWAFNDAWVGTTEWNEYWGNENTLFGQFKKSSNIQAGVKYIF